MVEQLCQVWRVGLHGDYAELDADGNLLLQFSHANLERFAHDHDVAAGHGLDTQTDGGLAV